MYTYVYATYTYNRNGRTYSRPRYGVAATCRLLKSVGLFCKRDS